MGLRPGIVSSSSSSSSDSDMHPPDGKHRRVHTMTGHNNGKAVRQNDDNDDDEYSHGRAVILPTSAARKRFKSQRNAERDSNQEVFYKAGKGKLSTDTKKSWGVKTLEGHGGDGGAKHRVFCSNERESEKATGTSSRQNNQKRGRRNATGWQRTPKTKQRFVPVEDISEDLSNEETEICTGEGTSNNMLDIPERLQIFEQFAVASDEDLHKEADWIYEHAFGNVYSGPQGDFKTFADMNKSDIVQEVCCVLSQLHFNKLEIPFIGMYRSQGCVNLAHGCDTNMSDVDANGGKIASLHRYKALWKVFFWHKKWILLQEQRKLLQEEYKKRSAAETEGSTKGVLLCKLIRSLQEVESKQALADIDAKFRLHFPPEEAKVLAGQYKRPKRRQSFYDLCRSSGLVNIADHFGLTAEQLGENLKAKCKRHKVADCSFAPEDIDTSHCARQFTEIQSAIEGARYMASTEISCEPLVREYVRNIFLTHSVVNTKPSGKGNVIIDEFHEYASVKSLQAKPVTQFENGEWLLIQKAKEEDLIDVVVVLPEDIISDILIQELQEYYLSTESTRVAELWNQQRKQILQVAVKDMLLPYLDREMQIILSLRAKSWVQDQCGKDLWKRVSIAPYPLPSTDSIGKSSCEVAPRVLACCWGSRNPPTTFVMLDAFGEVMDTLQTGYLNSPSGNYEHLQRKNNDQQKLEKFMADYQPHVVVLGASNPACRHLKDILSEVVVRVAEENPGLGPLTVVYGDESVPLLYEKSGVSLVQLQKQPSIIRRAVALGRYIQNPLAMVASLCSPSRDIVALILHPMQRFLTADEVYEAVEEVMITVSNQVGVDINLAGAHEWMLSPLQFISGLGPLKSSYLKVYLQSGRGISSRQDLSKPPLSMKENIYKNCCGFLRICKVGNAFGTLTKINPLDGTRIHPESYTVAESIALGILQKGQVSTNQADQDDVDLMIRALDNIKEHPEFVRSVDITDFSTSIEESRDISNIQMLKLIQEELINPFQDYRTPYTPPTQDEEFAWMTGENDDSLSNGRLVNATAQKIYSNRVMCVLESGLWGVIQKENFTPELNCDLSKVITEGTNLMCQISGVQKDRFLVNLMCNQHITQSENDYQLLTRNLTQEKKDSAALHFRQRPISHKLFQNIAISDAIKVLSNKECGEIVFHPSSRGPSCLSMVFKLHNNLYVQKEIVEIGKDSTTLSSFLKLGTILKIGNRSFQNLDEVIACYVCPLMDRWKELTKLKEFKTDDNTDVCSFLNQNTGIAYCLSVCHQSPGTIRVSYSMDGEVHHANFELCPDGYSYSDKMFRRIDTVVNFMKSVSLAKSGSKSEGQGGYGFSQNDGKVRRGRGGRFASSGRSGGFRGRGRGRGTNSSDDWIGNDRARDDENNTDVGQGSGYSSWWGSNEQKDHVSWHKDNDSGMDANSDGLLGKWAGGNSDSGNGRESFRGSRGRRGGMGRGRGRGRCPWSQRSADENSAGWTDHPPTEADDTLDSGGWADCRQTEVQNDVVSGGWADCTQTEPHNKVDSGGWADWTPTEADEKVDSGIDANSDGLLGKWAGGNSDSGNGRESFRGSRGGMGRGRGRWSQRSVDENSAGWTDHPPTEVDDTLDSGGWADCRQTEVQNDVVSSGWADCTPSEPHNVDSGGWADWTLTAADEKVDSGIDANSDGLLGKWAGGSCDFGNGRESFRGSRGRRGGVGRGRGRGRWSQRSAHENSVGWTCHPPTEADDTLAVGGWVGCRETEVQNNVVSGGWADCTVTEPQNKVSSGGWADWIPTEPDKKVDSGGWADCTLTEAEKKVVLGRWADCTTIEAQDKVDIGGWPNCTPEALDKDSRRWADCTPIEALERDRKSERQGPGSGWGDVNWKKDNDLGIDAKSDGLFGKWAGGGCDFVNGKESFRGSRGRRGALGRGRGRGRWSQRRHENSCGWTDRTLTEVHDKFSGRWTNRTETEVQENVNSGGWAECTPTEVHNKVYSGRWAQDIDDGVDKAWDSGRGRSGRGGWDSHKQSDRGGYGGGSGKWSQTPGNFGGDGALGFDMGQSSESQNQGHDNADKSWGSWAEGSVNDNQSEGWG